MNSTEVIDMVQNSLPPDAILIGIDGPGASGKSVLSSILAEHLAAQLVHVDDYYLTEAENHGPSDEHGWLFDLQRLRQEVLAPISSRQAANPTTLNWATGQTEPGPTLEASKLTIVEGVYSLREDLRKFYDFTIWVEAPEAVRLQRGLARDGDHARAQWVNLWMPAEQAYAEQAQPAAYANLRLRTETSESSELSYTLLP